MLLERRVRIIWNLSATSGSKIPVDNIPATLKWTAVEKVRGSETAINSTIQLFKYSTINITSFLTDVLQHIVENPLCGKMLKFLLLPSIRQAGLWGYALGILFKLCSLKGNIKLITMT